MADFFLGIVAIKELEKTIQNFAAFAATLRRDAENGISVAHYRTPDCLRG
jgi:hypothetical protein